jgi:hypothetical protein
VLFIILLEVSTGGTAPSIHSGICKKVSETETTTGFEPFFEPESGSKIENAIQMQSQLCTFKV